MTGPARTTPSFSGYGFQPMQDCVSTPSAVGEGRLIFGAVDSSGQPLAGGCTLIFEYRLVSSSEKGLLEWAKAWHRLSELDERDGRFLTVLDEIVRSFAHRSNAKSPALAQLRTSEASFGEGREFRQFALLNNKLILASADEYKLKAVTEILQSKLVKRNVPLKGLSYGVIQPAAGSSVRQEVTLQQGITKEKASEIVKAIKDSKKKAQAAIQGDLVRVSAKDRDTLQEIIALLKGKDFGIDMQFTNYRTN